MLPSALDLLKQSWQIFKQKIKNYVEEKYRHYKGWFFPKTSVECTPFGVSWTNFERGQNGETARFLDV